MGLRFTPHEGCGVLPYPWVTFHFGKSSKTARLLALGQLGFASTNLGITTMEGFSMEQWKAKADSLGETAIVSLDTLEKLTKTIDKYGGDSSILYLKSGNE